MQEAVRTRVATPAEATFLAEAEREIAQIPGRLASRPEELRDDAFRDKITKLGAGETGVFLVAERGGVVVGHGFLEPRELAATAHVVSLTLAVHEGYQGRGYGAVLLRALIGWAQSNPRVEKIELQVRSSNARAIALYERFGFTEEGRKLKRLKLGPGVYLDDVYLALWVGQ